MGTSTSHSSPNTPSWRIARQVLGRDAAPVARQSEEIWKAATADRGGRLGDELASSVLAAAGSIAAKATSPVEAVRAFNRLAADKSATGLTLEIGRRALMRAVAAGGGAAGFGAELFAEAVSYYASRDLSSYIASPGRVTTSTDSIALKDGLRAIARGAAGEVRVRTDSGGWSAFVRATLETLTRGKSSRGGGRAGGQRDGPAR